MADLTSAPPDPTPAPPDQMPVLTYQAAALTDIGPARRDHQDRIVLAGVIAARSGAWLQCDGHLGADGLLAAVIDGMGGHFGGAEAADVVASQVARLTGLPSPKDWTAAIESISDMTGRAGQAWDRPEMGATLAVVWLDPTGLSGINIGDCRVYRVQDGHIDQLTNDDRIITRRGSAVTQALGGPPVKLDPHFWRSPHGRHGERVVICSDGLWDALEPGQFRSLLRDRLDPTALVVALVEAAWAVPTPDNVSVVAIDIKPATAPVVTSPIQIVR